MEAWKIPERAWTLTMRIILTSIACVIVAIPCFFWIGHSHKQHNLPAGPPLSGGCVAKAQEVCIAGGDEPQDHYYHIPLVYMHKEINVQLGRISYDDSIVPALALAEALKHDGKADFFRMSWESSTPGSMGFIFYSTIHYNRRAHTLSYYSFVNPSFRTDRCLVAGVNDLMLQRLANSNGGKSYAIPGGPVDPQSAGFTNYLVDYGGRIVFSSSSFVPKS